MLLCSGYFVLPQIITVLLLIEAINATFESDSILLAVKEDFCIRRTVKMLIYVFK